MLNLNDANVLMQIMTETKQKWRSCRRKQYDIFACKVSSGIVFANKLEQPESFKAMGQALGKHIATLEECTRNSGLMGILRQCGCYVTDEDCILLCGTVGELWTVKEDKFKRSYTGVGGKPITKIPNGWFTVTRVSEAMVQAVGIYIPRKYVGMYRTAYGQVLYVNNPNSEGHGKGDVLVAPLVNGQPNLADCSPINSTVFARTYDLTVGGWGNLGLKANQIKLFTLDDCKRAYKIPEDDNILFKFEKLFDYLSDDLKLIPKMKCDYSDVEGGDSVWFSPLNGVNMRHLYKGFYIGIIDGDDCLVVTFRDAVAADSCIDIRVQHTVEAVKVCICNVLRSIKQSYNDYVSVFNYVVAKYGDKNNSLTGEEIDDCRSINRDGEYEGRYVGLKKNILSHIIGAVDEHVDAYLAVKLSYSINADYTKAVSCVDVWLQGEAIDNLKMGKKLECSVYNKSDLKKIDAMMNKIKSV